MKEDPLPTAMELDLVALEVADARFESIPRPQFDEAWEAHAWELATRIELVVAARAELENDR